MKQKLSEILFEAQKTKKQTINTYARGKNDDSKPESYCALGAIACATGFIKIVSDADCLVGDKMLNQLIGKKECRTFDKPFRCVLCEEEERHVSDMIVHLNDEHQLSFEEIGHYLAVYGL